MTIFPDPALNLVLALTPHPLTPAERERALELARQVEDWDDFVFWVKRQGVAGFALANSENLPNGAIPAPALEALRQLQRQSSLHSMKLLTGLGQIDRAFAACGLEYFTLKGPPLSQLLFSSFNLRGSGDIDLFVAPKDIEQASQALLEIGCTRHSPKRALRGLQARLYQGYYLHHYSFIEPERAFAIELHWTLAEPYLFSAEMTGRWLGRGISIEMPGLSTRTLSLEDTFAYTLLHGAKHRWRSARQYVDLLALLRRPDLDWEKAAAAIREASLERIASQGLFAMQKLWSAQIPPALVPILETGETIDFLVNTALNSIQLSDPEAAYLSPRRIFYEDALKADHSYRLRSLLRAAVEPEDWDILPLPDALFPLYFILRPFLWLWRNQGRR